MSHGPRPSADEAIAQYRRQLDAVVGTETTAAWWDEHLDVCIASVFTTMAPIKVAHERGYDGRYQADHDRIQWWAQRAADGLRRIERA